MSSPSSAQRSGGIGQPPVLFVLDHDPRSLNALLSERTGR
jgi:hypothetical protein